MNERKFHVGVKALIQNDEGKILILKINPRELKGNKHGVYWDLPGGRIKDHDSVEKTLRNEIKEELGVNGNKLDIVNEFHGSVSNIEIPVGKEKYGLVLLVYLCRLNTNKKFRMSSEHTEYKWSPVKEAKKLLAVKFSKDFIEKLDELD